MNLVLGDMVPTNIHGFVTIVTNHAGDDVYTFDNAVKPRSGAFYARQIVGSVNYEAGNNLLDFSHGWLNFQIEHHVWPNLSMLQYQKQIRIMSSPHGLLCTARNEFLLGHQRAYECYTRHVRDVYGPRFKIPFSHDTSNVAHKQGH